ncbi:unnamed protein product [Adineta steineri]|uniref:Uncharacterized protein n=1 Tax=Adineta steineri TaxID=433720 RepID=A0A818I8X7_9BILA|nr:unnamed protein product [Adineta steineri]CAF3518464.1 unnamed protein product [Adineta steineri]
MPTKPITQQPESRNSTFTLMPDEYVRFEYNYKPGCCCFSSKTTTITNMRLMTRTIETPTIGSRKTASGKERTNTKYIPDINNVKQLQSAIPISQNTWWMKLLDILTCRCSNQQIDWLESCLGMENSNESTVKPIDLKEPTLVERF